MFVSDVSDFEFVGKVKPAFFIANEEVVCSRFLNVERRCGQLHMIMTPFKEGERGACKVRAEPTKRYIFVIVCSSSNNIFGDKHSTAKVNTSPRFVLLHHKKPMLFLSDGKIQKLFPFFHEIRFPRQQQKKETYFKTWLQKRGPQFSGEKKPSLSWKSRSLGSAKWGF